MIVENITINGIQYTFETRNNKTELVYLVEVTDSNINDEVTIKIPNILVITRNTGEILFILECGGNDKFEIMTVKELYAKKIQWFEPLADNYRKLLFVSEKDYIKAAYKIFSWQDIYDFSIVDRIPMAYAKYNSGDWKFVKDGADGYILSLVDNVPYWSDAIGQIPFAIDTYRMLKKPEMVISVGELFATGDLIDAILGRADKTNEWDNYFVLRGVLFAIEKFEYRSSPYSSVSVEVVTNYAPDNLKTEISIKEKEKYLL